MTVVDTVTVTEKEQALMYDIMANCQDLKQDSSQRAADLQGNPTERRAAAVCGDSGITLATSCSKNSF